MINGIFILKKENKSMSVYQRGKIKLQDALSMDIEQSLRMWFVPGLHVDVEDVPENAKDIRTVVAKISNGTTAVLVEWSVKEKINVENINKFFLPLNFDEGLKRYMKIIAKVSKFEELQNTFPQLFEMDGYLYSL